MFAIIFTSIMAMANYVLIAYVTTLLVHTKLFLFRDALMINFFALLLLTVLIPLMGLLSDSIGRKPVFIAGLIGLLMFIFPFFWLLNSGSWTATLIAEVVFGIVLAPINATVPTIIAEMFPTEVRASGTSIGYNLGQAIFGGTLPIVALILTKITGNFYSPAWYVFSAVILVIIGVKFLEESYQRALV